MKHFVLLLTNESSMIDDDIEQIFQFEKKLAEVKDSLSIELIFDI